jgi:hypothetical protein
MALKIEAFLSTPPCANSVRLTQLLDEMKKNFGETIEVIVHHSHTEIFDAYNLTATPAVVIEELVKMMGFCPSRESLIAALQEVGLE